MIFTKLRLLFLSIPDTNSIESKRENLRKEFEELNNFAQSDELKHYEELRNFVQSNEFKQRVRAIKAQKFQDTPEYNKLQRYNQFKKQNTIKKYLKGKLSDSDLNSTQQREVQEYKELESFINSNEFRQVENYMKQSSSKKYQQSEEYKQLQEFIHLNKSDKIKWFYKFKDHSKFDELRRWELTFNDDFDERSLDKNKWLTKYYWGEKILHSAYSLSNDKHFVTDGKNLQLTNSALEIVTKHENAEGRAWHPKFGFHPKHYSYTSGVVNTGDIYKQKFGIIEAKISFNSNTPITQGFWMVDNVILPQINIAKLNKNKLELGQITGSIERKSIQDQIFKMNGNKFVNQYFIYTLEWSPHQLIWKINDKVIVKQRNTLPEKELSLLFTAGIFNGAEPVGLPASMKVDWVRCYQEAK
jgi:beta-glucanase (GH16 family)